MKENEALKIIRENLLQSLKAYGYNCEVLAGRQPTRQLLKDNAVYVFPIGESRAGLQRRSYSDKAAGAGIVHTESILVIKTLQLQAFLRREPEETDEPTASDLCATAKMIVESLPFVEAIRAEGVGISNVTGLREPEFINEAGDYEKNPSFDFDISFTRTITPTTGAVIGTMPQITGV